MAFKIPVFFFTIVLLSFALPSFGQDLKFEKARHRTMLDRLVSEVKRNYFDPEFKGINIDTKHREAVENLEKATGVGQLRSAIAQFFSEFNDSHMFFLPPGHVNNIEYGIDFRMVGDKCVVIYVDHDSDAEKKGLEVGDELRTISGFTPTRDSLWRVRYFFFVLFPQPSLELEVTKPTGRAATYEIKPKVITGTQVTQPDPNQIIRDSERNRRLATRQYFYDKFPEAFIWKMPAFSLEPHRLDGIIGRARKYPALVFDLRGNGGGRVDMTLRLIGSLFAEDVKVGDKVMRRRKKEVIAKSRGENAYTGKIAVLIDADSGSASEVIARVIQLEERGLVIGERSAGAVMESQYFGHQVGVEVVAFYGASISIADLIMKDGKSIEKIGVAPDIVIVPTPHDIASKRDVVLARVLVSLGVKITPEDAYQIFEHTLDGRSE